MHANEKFYALAYNYNPYTSQLSQEIAGHYKGMQVAV